MTDASRRLNRGYWLAGFAAIFAYTISTIVGIRSGLFDFSQRQMNPAEYGALWGYAGATLTATVAGLTVAVTNAQNLRSEKRLTLEAATSSLQLMRGDGGDGYASQGVVAGTLASLIQLDQDILAIRVLSPAWEEGVVHLDSAIWLLGQVMEHGDPFAQGDAVQLFGDICRELLESDRVEEVQWPNQFYSRWKRLYDGEDEIQLLSTLARILLACDPASLSGVHESILGRAIAILYTATAFRNRIATRTTAAMLLATVLPLHRTLLDNDFPIVVDNKLVTLDRLRRRAREPLAPSYSVQMETLNDLLEQWVEKQSSKLENRKSNQLALF